MIEKTVTIEVDEQYYKYLSTARGELDTRSEVVMVLPRPGGKILTLTKSVYPEGTYNLPSGGIHPAESPEDAFIREVAEETSLPSSPRERIGFLRRNIVCGNMSFEFISYIILGSLTAETPHAVDENENISGYRDTSITELRESAAFMLTLPPYWLNFGKFRSVALELVADYLVNLPTPLS